jgi:hypothetical protein
MNRSNLMLAQLLIVVAFATRTVLAGPDAAIRSVPFQRAPSPYVVIGVPIKGQGSSSLLFDTGTHLSIVSPELAAKLALSHDRPMAIASVAGRTTARTAVAAGIGFELAPETRSPSVVVTDVTAVRSIVGNVNGILGQSLLGPGDYFIDYKARRLTLGPPGQLTAAVAGHHVPLEWSEGRPAIVVRLRATSGCGPGTVKLVLDSGIDRLTLFGAAARQVGAVARSTSMVRVDGPLGTATARAAPVIVAIDRDIRTVATLMAQVQDREEDGLIPTSLFRSVYVSGSDRIVVLDGTLGLRAD